MLWRDGQFHSRREDGLFLAAVLAAISTALLFLLYRKRGGNAGMALLDPLRLASWCWLVASMGGESQVLNFSNRVLKYANDAVLPVYVVHQTLIVTFGYLLLNWNVVVAVKYPLIVAVTLFSSLAIYEAARRTQITRFLFGMRLRQSPKPAVVSVQA